MNATLPFLLSILDRRIQSQFEVWHGLTEAADASGWPYPIEEVSRLRRKLETQSCLGVLSWRGADRQDLVGIPIINLSNYRGPLPDCGNLLNEDRAIGRMAADHLLGNGYSTYLTVGLAQPHYSRERMEGFSAKIQTKGLPLHSVDFPMGRNWTPKAEWNPQRYLDQSSEELEPILRELPPDTGIFAVDHPIAQQIEHCLYTRFPERVHTTGLLAGDLPVSYRWLPGSRRSLSCVRTANAARGKAAMDWFIKQETQPEPIAKLCRFFPPAGIFTQASTAGPACRHPILAWGIRWSWTRIQGGEPPTVEEMASYLKMSSRTLNRLFQSELSQTARGFLLTLRMERAAQTLQQNPQYSIQRVAEEAGFTNQGAFTSTFRSWSGQNPREYRKTGGSG
ncbi:MAG: helix-turn-helix domain-containing protein [Opitutales bacterium]|nr:helix-turn-helix domain-containing protein [Opitutales bacterium]MCH8541921.1 helix-turn-helix domain-containing protein [Opitutales bacterium]